MTTELVVLWSNVSTSSACPIQVMNGCESVHHRHQDKVQSSEAYRQYLKGRIMIFPVQKFNDN